MNKFVSTFCLLLALFHVHLEGTLARGPTNFITDTIDCPKGTPPAVCGRRLTSLFPTPRIGRSVNAGQPQDYYGTFSRTQRVFGLVKQPRVGRSDPLLSAAADESDSVGRFQHDAPDGWLQANPDFAGRYAGIPAHPRGRASGEKYENYLSAQRRDSNGPWAFFLITPNFQNQDQQPILDNVASQLGREGDEIIEE